MRLKSVKIAFYLFLKMFKIVINEFPNKITETVSQNEIKNDVQVNKRIKNLINSFYFRN